jgi:hypothetical protein
VRVEFLSLRRGQSIDIQPAHPDPARAAAGCPFRMSPARERFQKIDRETRSVQELLDLAARVVSNGLPRPRWASVLQPPTGQKLFDNRERADGLKAGDQSPIASQPAPQFVESLRWSWQPFQEIAGDDCVKRPVGELDSITVIRFDNVERSGVSRFEVLDGGGSIMPDQ